MKTCLIGLCLASITQFLAGCDSCDKDDIAAEFEACSDQSETAVSHSGTDCDTIEEARKCLEKLDVSACDDEAKKAKENSIKMVDDAIAFCKALFEPSRSP
eukprot:TRINITY_DN76489_c0_g1_i1.p3 TRINITY_DN76489_c0_g1~~TRINITY_DN76489_c0_g1_i1.p3  ORF type:complete len:101 (+),score=14.21 TRINITY_DN76489_c0_g1_i1:55-357(+)